MWILPQIIFQDKVELGDEGSSIHSARLFLPARLEKNTKKQK